MVKVTGGGRGMAAIAAHLRYISKGGRLPIEDDRGLEREGKEALREMVDQWRLGGSRIPELSERREAFNIMLSMPAGTKPAIVQSAAREFAKVEFADHRYVMVLHTHQANPHVHLSVRAEGRDGQRLNPRKADLRRWRETFAERLRGWGIEAEASSQVTRGSGIATNGCGSARPAAAREAAGEGGGLPTGVRQHALQAWAEITRALAASPEAAHRQPCPVRSAAISDAPPAGQAIVRHQASSASCRASGGRHRSCQHGRAKGRRSSARSVRRAVSSPPDGLGGRPSRAACPSPRAWVRTAPRQGFTGAGLRPPLTRRAARMLAINAISTRRDSLQRCKRAMNPVLDRGAVV